MSPNRKRLQNQCHRRSGATVLEAAIVLPVAVVGLLLMLDLGMAVAQSNSLADSARHAGRTAIVCGGDSAQPLGPATWSGTLDESHPLAESVRPRLLAMLPERVTLTATWPDGENQQGDRVHVELQYDHPPLLAVMPEWFEISANSTMHILH